MSKWSKLKLALLTATSTLSALALGGCLSGDVYRKIVQYTVIASIFE